MNHLTRRGLITGSSAALAGGAVAAALGVAATAPGRTAAADLADGRTDGPASPATPALAVEPFHGVHQAGIDTPHQSFGAFIGLDLADGTTRPDVVRLLRLLTDDAERLTQGRPALGDTEPELATRPASLTITVGFGHRFFDITGTAARRPAGVRPLPAFAGDKLQARWGQSDVVVQVCTDDVTTLAHTQRMLIKDMRPFGSLPWVQRGFASPGATPKGTARNLMGQVDGTVNPEPGTDVFDRAIWATDPGWFAGGTVLVLRRVAMIMETWDAFDRDGKEQVIGRRLDTGAPLTGTREEDIPDLEALDSLGFPVIEPNAHIRLAKARTEAEVLLRRPFSFDDGVDAAGTPDVGLLFAAFTVDPDRSFVPIQRRLAENDLLNTWVTHIGSGVWAVPPGVAPGEFIGQGLLAED
ncbi:MAG: Dyp-type peroxidase [Kineosporiaceae bacterium]|nr:Dyp-type peroxidase [Kineosporiaceae bacterium]